MEFSVDSLSKTRLAIHILSAIIIFVAWCVNIAVFTTDGSMTGGADSWYFALCFLSVPPILYQTLTLRFVRSRRWANAYAFAALDIVWSIFWFTAFVSVAVWNTDSKCGSSKACALSKALVGLGFFLFLFFAVCSAISIHGLLYFRSTGIIPGSSRIPSNANMIDPDREAFSTQPHDEYAPVGMNDKDDHANSDDDENLHGLHHQQSSQSLGQHVNPLGLHQTSSYENMNTSYQGGGLGGVLNDDHGVVGHDAHPSGTFMTPDDVGGSYSTPYVAGEAPYGEEPTHTAGGNLQFPAGNYH